MSEYGDADNTRSITKRDSLIMQITSLKKFIDEYKFETNTLEELEIRLEKVQESWPIFDEIQTFLEQLDKTQEKFRLTFENIFYPTVGKGRKLWKEHNSKINPNIVLSDKNIPTIQTDNLIRLPKIDLPTFDGAYDSWLGFFDSFRTLIHERTNLSETQKLQYLRSCLKGEATKVVNSLDSSAESYTSAWNLLIERFNNKRIIVHKHLRGLLEYPSVTKYSPQSLRQFLDNINSHMRALKLLEQNIDGCDSLFIYLMTSKLDMISRQEWEKVIPGSNIPTIKQFLEFLQTRCQILEATNHNINHDSKNNFKSHTPNASNKTQQVHVSSNSNNSNCPICKQPHAVYMCESFLQADTHGRLEMAKKANLCINCLRTGHSTKKCRSQACKFCQKYHNSLLHHTNSINNNSLNQTESVTKPKVCNHTYSNSEVLLSTARIYFVDKHGKNIDCRVLLDPGSQSNLITKELANKLGLPKTSVHIPIAGINQLTTYINHSIIAIIKSRFVDINASLTFVLIDQITGSLPTQQISRQNIQIPKNIKLADPEFHQPNKIDALIGAELFYTLMSTGLIKLNNYGATLKKSVFGWIVSGKIIESSKNSNAKSCNISTIENKIESFWKIEEIPDRQHFSNEEIACEEHFLKNYFQNENGQIVVKLPFNQNKDKLGNSYNIALKRLYSLEQKFKRDINYKEKYTLFLREYEKLGHMSEIDEKNTNSGYYLPHHAVLKEESSTTKVRVVFDGSAKTSSGLSLNETLMVGPTLQDDIHVILLRCRFLPILITADIEKMYRKVLVDTLDRIYQKILWREDQ